MISFKKKIAVAALLVFTLVFSACKKDEQTKVIRLGHALDVSHPVHKAMKFMADRIEEKSDGRLKVDIYSSQQLGSERELIELLQIGSLGMTKVSTGTLENFAPELKVFGLPFLFKDRQHRFNVLESEIGEKLLESSVRNRLKGLTFYDAGSRSFYSTKPLNSPQDLKGQKVRVMESQTAMNMVKYLGGSPTPVSWGELYTALQQGIVDGAENNLPSFYLSYHYEVCKHFMVDEHTALPDELLIGTVVWNKLTEQEQKWVKEAAMESSEYEKEIWREAELHALEEIKKAGVKVTYPEKEQFREMVQPMYDKFKEDPELKKTIEAIQAIK
ncbi:TRAP transporter substrate-binding protein [Mesonia aestuariivivens]|uniref:TRAP transporter substrate-binding protein n=1 Tax=Mesonia aestuariivivens TaxID=2796128 RepID=A0ABS6W1Q8_9FLAO|nr:TRAP transporter substrate-binding protein [Mesonia aestuariivivens]MBW2961776.1 TRAP transporter substrate-binding protein [Mesonia aestuariivivens]